MSKPLGNLFIVAAPSGAGKSSLISALIERANDGQMFNPAQLSVSHTTRKPRDGEKNGEHYHFIDVSKFEAMIKEDAFYEHAQVFDNFYGTSKEAISNSLEAGIDVFLDIDWQGARQIKAVNPDVISIFILPPSKEELHARLVSRGKDSDEVIAGRMRKAQDEMSHYNEFDYLIVNDNFTHALEELITVVKAHSLRTNKQQTRFSGLLNSLLSEK
ncbi:guanylate kinase [Glaciecola sp. 2405UD65-10]|jgi:guanylate kinase|uniref:guanylate kinase n=1 Tax=Glaciecola sp. 2405UD65-10 TaxID=3397244 RepID=UPI003B5A2B30